MENTDRCPTVTHFSIISSQFEFSREHMGEDASDEDAEFLRQKIEEITGVPTVVCNCYRCNIPDDIWDFAMGSIDWC